MDDQNKSAEKISVEKKIAEKNPDNKTDRLISDLKAAVENLIYISETDAGFDVFVQKSEQPAKDASAADVLKFGNYEPQTKIEEKTLDEFFAQPTEMQDWYGEEEKAQVEKYLKLKKLLTNRLKSAKVFRVGEIQIDIYLVGIDEAGNLAGVKTKAIET